MIWDLIEQHHYRDSVRRWTRRPCAAQPTSSTRMAVRVEGLGEQLVVVDAATHTAVTGPVSSRDPDAAGSVTAPETAAGRAVHLPRPARPAAPTVRRAGWS